jgi:hypothetical protein
VVEADLHGADAAELLEAVVVLVVDVVAVVRF